jgi:ribosome-associated protein
MSEPIPTSAPEESDELVVTGSIRVPLDEFEFTYVRSSGPGGQNVNKLATKAQLRWPFAETPSLPAGVRERFERKYGNRITNDGDLLITSQQYRKQDRNARDCLEKLREMILSVAEPPKPRRRTKPSRGAVQRRINEKKQRSEKKQGRKPPKFE